MRDSIQLEQLGIPTLTLVTTSFARLARATSTGLGMPDQSFQVVPHPMGGIPDEQVRKKIRDVLPDLQRDLTEWHPSPSKSTPARVQKYVSLTGSVADVHAEFQARGWSAGLPFIPPTRDLVDDLLAGTSHDRDEVVWDGVPPRMGILTIELVAACAAMAGCKPEHMPVLLAIVEALRDPAAWYAHQATTTGTESLMLLLNGPIVAELGIATGTGAAGLWYRPNAGIGYAIGLIAKVVGGSKPPDRDKSTLASPADLTNWCLAENVAESPWPSLAEDHGFSRTDNVVTVKVVYPPIDINDHQSTRAEELLHYIAHSINQPYVYAMRDAPVVLALCPEHAETLAADGYTKPMIRSYLWEHARFPADVYAPAAWESGAIKPTALIPSLGPGTTTPIPIVARPENLEMVVLGGPGKHSHFFPGPKGMVTRKISPWR